MAGWKIPETWSIFLWMFHFPLPCFVISQMRTVVLAYFNPHRNPQTWPSLVGKYAVHGVSGYTFEKKSFAIFFIFPTLGFYPCLSTQSRNFLNLQATWGQLHGRWCRSAQAIQKSSVWSSMLHHSDCLKVVLTWTFMWLYTICINCIIHIFI